MRNVATFQTPRQQTKSTKCLERHSDVDLGLDADFFEDKLDQPMATLRLLHYPPQPATADAGQIGAGAHTDYGDITLLHTDGVGGLEVRRCDGGWIAAPTVPGAFICNIGDCLMRWTNDVYVPTPHRVVNRAGRERYSVAFFLDPNPDAEVACLPGCISADRPARYPPVKAADYLRERLVATYGPPSAPTRPADDAPTMTRLTKAQHIHQTIADDIVHGRLVPGAPLDETAIAAAFRCFPHPRPRGHPPTGGDRLVKAQARRGVVVTMVSDCELDEMFAVMAELEALCALVGNRHDRQRAPRSC